MMDLTNIKDIEELVTCNLCKQKFNHLDSVPKLLTCKHYFCLSCIRSTMMKGMEVFCVNCWKRTELEEQDPEVLPTYNPVLVLSTSLSNIKNSINGGSNVPTVNHDTIPPDKDKKVCSLISKVFHSFLANRARFVQLSIHFSFTFHNDQNLQIYKVNNPIKWKKSTSLNIKNIASV